jgi:DNA invertase Pin-like site-specific DNA recombinase
VTRAYSYIRFSTPEQAAGDSLRRQTELAEEYCARHGLTLDTSLTLQDLGVSGFRGRNLEGGAFTLFRRAIEDGIVPQGSVLLVENLDRLSRMPAYDAFKVLSNIVDAGVDIVTLKPESRHSRDSLRKDMGSLITVILQMQLG